ncbi:protein kinase domain-containing protein [Compostimonas suwonensis]|uniref:non-specific serine/threonine protein kinase n=1 Tax=Compostimonas suwonensis TaxID=1048394 RepID=A0A2M9C430_9MICO|nr:protein kinase [Compostimonas suwonensis]PJJ65278.1 serine/threonine-protein kinase [Compostimonas suwonensis]
MRPTAGLTFGGRYELQSRIAIGGMGEVWQATDLVIGRTVAIKILKDEYLGDPGFLERFRAEARHAALVNHEGIANVFDYGEEEGSAYLVMELVPGEPLSAILEREHVLSTDRVLDIMAQTAAALQAAHSAGLVHRDIKPGNLLITPEGRVKITDFGIARIADQVPLTATGQVMGTVQYLSPEQASGHPASPTTDIYSLGIVAYECLAGRRPFTGESQVAIAMAQINEAPPELPVTVAVPVRNFVLACIAKNPADRPASAAHVARAAQALRRGDIAAAAAAVPAILGGAAALPTQATTLLPSSAPTQATTLLPAGAPLDEQEEPLEKKKRSPWTWPLIALIALLAIALVGTIIAILIPQGGGTTQPSQSTTSSSTPSSTPTRTSTPTTTPTPTTVTVTEDQFLGKSSGEARDILQNEGLVADVQQGNAATTPEQVDTVYSVNPTGNLQEGATVTLKVYGPMAAITPPSSSPALNGGGPTFEPNASVKVKWAAGQCPAGQELTGYKLYSNDPSVSIPNAGSFQASVTDTTITAGSDSFSLTYTFFCGPVESGQSPPLDVTVQAASNPTNTPAGDEGDGQG